MAFVSYLQWLIFCSTLLYSSLPGSKAIDIFLEWNVTFSDTISPLSAEQPVIAINGLFPGPLINATTNDVIHVNVFNFLDESLLFTWNGIQQRLNSWQDGVSGTNCPILPSTNWTYVFQTKDQIGTFFNFPSINFQKAAGGYGPILVPFPKPEAEFDLLIGDWSSSSYKEMGAMNDIDINPDATLMNGKGPYGDPRSTDYESFTVTIGKTYRLSISNVGSTYSFNFRIQNHTMLVVETEGSYTNQTTAESLDVHVGQSYSILVTADQDESDYYIVASPKFLNSSGFNSSITGIGVLHYSISTSLVSSPIPGGPDPFDIVYSMNQAKSIRWNMTAGAARPNPQGTFNVSNVTISQTFVLQAFKTEINGTVRYAVNNVSYETLPTPLKLADYLVNGSGVYRLDYSFPTDSVNAEATFGVSVVSGIHKGWIELVFKNNFDVMDSWHLDGFGFYVVGFGIGDWTLNSRNVYNFYDPVVRSTTQVYPGGWTAVYGFLDNPGMWNLRSQSLVNWYLGQELYIRVHDPDPDPAKERPPPLYLLLCGGFEDFLAPAAAPTPAPETGL